MTSWRQDLRQAIASVEQSAAAESARLAEKLRAEAEAVDTRLNTAAEETATALRQGEENTKHTVSKVQTMVAMANMTIEEQKMVSSRWPLPAPALPPTQPNCLAARPP